MEVDKIFWIRKVIGFDHFLMTHKFLMMTIYEDMRVDNGRG